MRELEGNGLVVGTKFRPGGFSGFLPAPVSALTGRVLPLAEAFGAAGVQLDAALAAVADVDAVITEVSAFLRTHRPAPDRQRALVGLPVAIEQERTLSRASAVYDLECRAKAEVRQARCSRSSAARAGRGLMRTPASVAQQQSGLDDLCVRVLTPRSARHSG